MTPKEKAQELVDKFYNKYTNANQFGVSDLQKEFALIAVDEILNLPFCHNYEQDEYWNQVKTEIEKM